VRQNATYGFPEPARTRDSRDPHKLIEGCLLSVTRRNEPPDIRDAQYFTEVEQNADI
jgi:hypothetical protein